MNYTLEITPDELKLIDAGLQNLPFGQVSVLYEKLKNQISEQVKENTKEDTSGAD